MKPVKTTIWADFTIRDIKVAITRIKPAYIKPQESLAKKHRISANGMTWSQSSFTWFKRV